MIGGAVLVLNRSFLPINITSVKRAFCLLYLDIARAVNEEYKLFNFESWSKIPVEAKDDTIGLVDRVIKIPRVIMVLAYDRIPSRHVRFNRLNIFARDNNTCQYCGEKLPKSRLNIDHIIPRSRGGKSTWENVVCCCISCNRKKGGRTPNEAKMRLIKNPQRPKYTPLLKNIQYKEWMPFLKIVDIAYWNTELEE
jgi:5-methylcytosine-specific restriction endonuclease McrA